MNRRDVTPEAGSDRGRAARIAVALAVASLGMAAVGLWLRDRESGPVPPLAGGPLALDPSDPWPGAAVPVAGNPGWDLLSAEDRARASLGLAPEAADWLQRNAAMVRRTARRFEVSPVTLGGIVAAEKTLLTGRVDAVGEEVFGAVLGSLRERDLARWIDDQEKRYRESTRAVGERRLVRDPYLWTLGPAQVSFRLAVQYEPIVARRLERPQREKKEILRAVRSVPGNLEYAAALLAEAQRAYRLIAGMEIAGNPGVLATLYHLGSPATRARRLAEANALRRARGDPLEFPRVNYYGAFVNLHAEDVAALLGVEGRGPETDKTTSRVP